MARQVLHIFRKDLRHHWPEVVIAAALLAALVWLEPSRWTGLFASPELQILGGWVRSLVPISWAFLIVRLVQGENLVGDRQFWITRPYEWKWLLGEKVLFVLAAVNLPLCVAQLILLRIAGFSPARYIGDVLFLQLLWLLLFVLPVMTLAVVTSGVGQAVVVVLAGIACVITIAIAESSVSTTELPRQGTFAKWVPLVAGLGSAVAIVIWQYARRRTLRARVAVIAVILLGAFALPPLMPRKSVANAYPAVNGGAAVAVELSFDSQKRDLGTALVEKKTVVVRLPLTVSGIADRSVVDVDGAKLAIVAPGGRAWQSSWQGGGEYFPSSRRTFADFNVERSFYEAVKNSPVNASVAFAISVYRESEPVQVTAQAGGFAVPGNGRCALDQSGEMLCLFPIRVPSLMAEIPSDGLRCPPPRGGNPLPTGLTGYMVRGQGNRSIADFGISPVDTLPILSWGWEFGAAGARFEPGGICTGTPLRFGFLSQAGGTRTDIQLNGIRLADYTPRPAPGGLGGATGFSFGIW